MTLQERRETISWNTKVVFLFLPWCLFNDVSSVSPKQAGEDTKRETSQSSSLPWSISGPNQMNLLHSSLFLCRYNIEPSDLGGTHSCKQACLSWIDRDNGTKLTGEERDRVEEKGSAAAGYAKRERENDILQIMPCRNRDLCNLRGKTEGERIREREKSSNSCHAAEILGRTKWTQERERLRGWEKTKIDTWNFLTSHVTLSDSDFLWHFVWQPVSYTRKGLSPFPVL